MYSDFYETVGIIYKSHLPSHRLLLSIFPTFPVIHFQFFPFVIIDTDAMVGVSPVDRAVRADGALTRGSWNGVPCWRYADQKELSRSV